MKKRIHIANIIDTNLIWSNYLTIFLDFEDKRRIPSILKGGTYIKSKCGKCYGWVSLSK